MDQINKSSIQKMIYEFLEKVENIPLSGEFRKTFSPEEDAQYSIGLIVIWVREKFSQDKLERCLSEIEPPRKSTNQNIYFMSNDRIAFIYEVYRILEIFKGKKDDYKNIKQIFPGYDNQPICDGSCIPIETVFSDFLFAKMTEIKKIGSKEDGMDLIAYLVFHSGIINDYYDLYFIGLALQDFQMHDSHKIYIYTFHDPADIKIRNFIDKFQKDFDKFNTEFEFKCMRPNHDLSILGEKL